MVLTKLSELAVGEILQNVNPRAYEAILVGPNRATLVDNLEQACRLLINSTGYPMIASLGSLALYLQEPCFAERERLWASIEVQESPVTYLTIYVSKRCEQLRAVLNGFAFQGVFRVQVLRDERCRVALARFNSTIGVPGRRDEDLLKFHELREALWLYACGTGLAMITWFLAKLRSTTT